MICLKTFDSINANKSLKWLKIIYQEEKNRSIYNLIRDIENTDYRFDGWVSLLFDNNQIVSCAALEKSFKYTNDNDSLRFSRYYKLKSKRKINYNFYNYIEEYKKIAKDNRFKVLYFTVFNPKVYNAIFYKKSIDIYKKYKDTISIDDFKIRDDILFKINDNCVQYIFEYKIDNTYSWNPLGNCIVSRNLYSDNDIVSLYKYSLNEGMV